MRKNEVTPKKTNEDKANSNPKQGKRIGVCTECGYEWIGRNAKSEKPPRCSECGSRLCVWEDTLSDNELKELKPLLHGITESTKKETSTAKEPKPDEATPPDKDGKQDADKNSETTEEQKPEPTPKAEPKPLSTTKSQKKEEKPTERIFISELKEFATVIDNPTADTEEEKPPVVAWKTKEGDIKYGTVLDTETVEQIEEILETAAEKEVIPTQKDLDILKAAGILEEEGLQFEIQDSKTQKPTKKVVPKAGISVKGLLVVGGIVACTQLLPIILAAKERNKKPTAYYNNHPQKIDTETPQYYFDRRTLGGKLQAQSRFPY